MVTVCPVYLAGQVCRLQGTEHGGQLRRQVPDPVGGPGAHPQPVQQVRSGDAGLHPSEYARSES